MERHEAAAGTQRGAGGKKGRTGHGLASGNYEESAVVVLVGVVFPSKESWPEVFRSDICHLIQ